MIENKVCDLYDEMVDWFDTHRYKGLMEKEYLQLIVNLIPHKGSILDLGCGTGEPIAKFFIEKGYSLTGIDASPKMVQCCQKRFPLSTYPNTHFICADMRYLASIPLKKSLQSVSFDAILAWDSFFHLTPIEQETMFPIFQSYLKPQGVLLFTSGIKHGECVGEMNGKIFPYGSLDTKEYQKLLTKNNLNILLHRIEDPNCGEHTVWFAQKQNL